MRRAATDDCQRIKVYVKIIDTDWINDSWYTGSHKNVSVINSYRDIVYWNYIDFCIGNQTEFSRVIDKLIHDLKTDGSNTSCRMFASV